MNDYWCCVPSSILHWLTFLAYVEFNLRLLSIFLPAPYFGAQITFYSLQVIVYISNKNKHDRILRLILSTVSEMMDSQKEIC